MGDLRSPHAIAGVVLAGGRSSRMGVEKALVDFAGRPMLAHVLARFAPQVMALAINANGDPARFAAFGAPVIADLAPDQPGPLAGIAAALAWAQAHGCSRVATVPCDAPFLPRDLVALLARQPLEAPAVAMGPEGWEPLFALWPVAALSHVEARLFAGERAVHRVLAGLGAKALHLPDTSPPWTLNLNAPDDLARARALAVPTP